MHKLQGHAQGSVVAVVVEVRYTETHTNHFSFPCLARLNYVEGIVSNRNFLSLGHFIAHTSPIPWSAADMEKEIPVLVQSLKSSISSLTSFQ